MGIGTALSKVLSKSHLTLGNYRKNKSVYAEVSFLELARMEYYGKNMTVPS